MKILYSDEYEGSMCSDVGESHTFGGDLRSQTQNNYTLCNFMYINTHLLREVRVRGAWGCVRAVTEQSPRGFVVLVIFLDMGVGYTSVFGLIFIK